MSSLTADYAVRIVTDPDEADMSVVLTDANGDVVMNAADCTGGGPGAHDYEPYTLDVNASDPAAVIVGLGPWSYYKMDEASGLIQDSSGNGRHATSSAGSIAYGAAAITTKRTKSIEFDGGRFVIPKPFAVDSGNVWSAIWLERISAFHGTGSPAQASVMFGQTVGGSSAALTICNTAAGDFYVLWGTEAGINHASYVQNANIIGRPCVVALVANPSTQPRCFIDGVQWGAAQNGGLIGPSSLCVGSSDDGFWGFPKHRMSDLAFFDRGLTHAEIITITEALADAALFSTAVTL